MLHIRPAALAFLIAVLCLGSLNIPVSSASVDRNEIKALRNQLRQTRIQLEEMRKRLDQLERRQAAQEQTRTMEPDRSAYVPPAPPAGTSSPNAFNPEISAVLNGKFQSFSRAPNRFSIPGFPLGDAAGLDDRGLSLSESEVDINADVDNQFYGSLTLSFAPGGGVDVEEAYLQTLSLPLGLTLKAGRFFSGIGYLNRFHTHHDDFIDRPLPYRALLNTQFGDDGVQMRWLAPADTFLELGGEILRGDVFPAGGAGFHGAGTWTAFGHIGGDVGFSNSWKGGFSYLQSRSVNRDAFNNQGNGIGVFSGDSKLLMTDLVWKWAPNGNPVNENFRFQSEEFYRLEDGRFGGESPVFTYDGRQFGWYVEGVYQFMPRWKLGIRHAELSSRNTGAAVSAGGILDDSGHDPRRDSLVLGFSNSEFSRIRLQLSRDATQPAPDYQLALQYLMLLGAHGAHAF